MTALGFATWNINLTGGEQAALRKVNFLRNQPWDVVALQEVTPEAAVIWAAAGFDEWIYPKGVEKHGVALAARNGVKLTEPALMQELPIPQRGLWALATKEELVVEVGSLHITNASNGKGLEKRKHYEELVNWLQRPVPARLLGMDANHAFWPKWPDLPDAVYEPRDDDWAVEYAFFSADNTHGFKDVWFEQLKQDAKAVAEATRTALEQPSAFSYAKNRRQGKLIYERMDFVYASGLDVGLVVYNDAGRGPGLSDHAIVTASLHA